MSYSEVKFVGEKVHDHTTKQELNNCPDSRL